MLSIRPSGGREKKDYSPPSHPEHPKPDPATVAGGSDARSARTRVGVFAGLLVVVLLLTMFYAVGVFPLSAGGVFSFVVYVLLGLLAAVCCYGILDSSGTIVSSQSGTRVALQGSVVALALVAGGGMSYERWFRTPDLFDMRLSFIDEDGQPLRVSGTVSILFLSKKLTARVTDEPDVLFQSISQRERGTPFSVDLMTPPYRAIGQPELALGEGPIVVTLGIDTTLAAIAGALYNHSKPVSGAVVALADVPCDSVMTGTTGYFSFPRCAEAQRLINPRVSVRLPGTTEPCQNLISVLKPPLITEIKLRDCGEVITFPGASPPRQPSNRDSAQLDSLRSDSTYVDSLPPADSSLGLAGVGATFRSDDPGGGEILWSYEGGGAWTHRLSSGERHRLLARLRGHVGDCIGTIVVHPDDPANLQYLLPDRSCRPSRLYVRSPGGNWKGPLRVLGSR
jgi:hypothetical protein